MTNLNEFKKISNNLWKRENKYYRLFPFGPTP